MNLVETTKPREHKAAPRIALATLFLTMLAMAVSFSFVFAVLPPIGRDLGLTELQLALVVAPAALVFVLANGVWGMLSERLGRKLVIVVAVTAATLANAGFGWIVHARLGGTLSVTATFVLLLACRVLLGAFAGGFLPAAQAYIADITPADQRTRALAVIGAGFALGMVAGPAIASATAGFGAIVPFYTVAALTAAVTLLVIFVLAKPKRHARIDGTSQRTTNVRSILPLLAIIVLIFTAHGIVLQVTGFRMQDQFGLSGEEAARLAGIALMVLAAGLVLTQIAIARSNLSTTRSGIALVIGGLATLIAMALLAFVDGFPYQLAGMALFGVGLGIVLPSALGLLTVIADAAGDQGRVGGWSGAAQGLGLVFGPLAGAAAYRLDHGAPYLIGIALALAAAAIGALAASRLPGGKTAAG